MSEGRDPLCQLRLGPPELPDGANVPRLLLERQIRLHDDHVLRPADGHGRGYALRGRFRKRGRSPASAAGFWERTRWRQGKRFGDALRRLQPRPSPAYR